MAMTEENRRLHNNIKRSIFGDSDEPASKGVLSTKRREKDLVSARIAEDTAAFLAAGKTIKQLPSEQVPPKKRPAMQQYGGGGFFEL